jgi:shikimate 5-dehydrogenase
MEIMNRQTSLEMIVSPQTTSIGISTAQTMSQAIQASADTVYPKAEKPTMYFFGVTTGKSSIMKVFPLWAEHLGLGDVAIQGIDCKQHDDPDVYRRAVGFIKTDALSRGALVTTHKIDLLAACRDLFDELDFYAKVMGEVSSISKRGSRLIGHAKDPITSGLALEAFLPTEHWKRTGAEAFVMGAGGSSIAATSYMMDGKHGDNRPSKLIVTNRSPQRLEEIEKIHDQLGCSIPTQYHLTPSPEENDAILQGLKPHSLVVNATGLGKDAPGSPLTDAAIFPEGGLVWDFNYRGNLVFLDQARTQEQSRQLTIEDGWVYFIHGWTGVIAEVFAREIPTEGPTFHRLSQIAAGVRNKG